MNHHTRSHAAHSRGSEGTNTSTVITDEPPSQLLQPKSEDVRIKLEELDDVIFHAISGDSNALELAKTLWPQVVAEIGWELVEESREQYLRFAIEVAKRFETDELRNPERAAAALDIISLIAKD